MRLFTIILCELIMVRAAIRFLANYCPTGTRAKSKHAVIDFIIDLFELLAVIAAPILLIAFC